MTGSYSAGLLVLAGALVFEAVLVMTLAVAEDAARAGRTMTAGARLGRRLTSHRPFATLPAERMHKWR